MERRFTKDMKKLRTFFTTLVLCTMFSVTIVTAATFNFSLMTENVNNSNYERKNNDTAYAGVSVTSLSYPSATIKFKAYKEGKGFVSNYNSVRGINSTQVIYTSTVYNGDKIKLYGYNPSSNGGVTVSVSGNWTP